MTLKAQVCQVAAKVVLQPGVACAEVAVRLAEADAAPVYDGKSLNLTLKGSNMPGGSQGGAPAGRGIC